MTLLELIRRPHAFYEALKTLPPVPWRYAWLPALAGLASGVSGALLSRAVLDSQAVTRSALPVAFLWGVTIFSSVFLSMLTWLVLWGMGHLGAGKDARSGEVYGTSFLAPLLWSVVLAVLALLVPPQVNVAAPNLTGLTGQAFLTAVQKYTGAVMAQYSQSPVVKFSSVMGYAIYLVQFWLAFIGLQVMTGDRRLAWRGVLYPGVLFLALGVAAILVSSVAATLLGGLA
ncbi:hypothetical protein [Deinococcus aquiradiocola]|uniref:Yip1 domain-containing protein n=1 Tax=Deinococcus aquiradiocola TaxID=393059 RepID=A0A917UQ40_9DEIO|nr:hypothetical protein [Deinococcus aquiradiocola]GGJ73822.1 hypothetical protein GCM10008939_17630 [Deinococcus aquiradiocola]